MARRVLITGATGFAGSFLVEHYAQRGWKVFGTYRDGNEDHSWLPPGVSLQQIDLLDDAAVSRLVGVVRPDLVHHLAAQSSVSASWQDPLGTLQGNTAAQYHLLEAVATLRPAARVLVVGSCDEYGDVAPADNPVAETHPLCPINPYALSKVAQDLMGYQYARVQGLAVVRVRPFLQIGPRRSDRFVAGSFARQVAEIELGLREPVIEVGTIDLQRDFTDVRDVARSLALAAERGMAGEVYNVASGQAHSLRDLLRSMLAVAHVQAEIRTAAERQRVGEPPLLVGDATRLHDLTGWKPEISFEQSAADTLAYWRERLRRAVVPEGGLS